MDFCSSCHRNLNGALICPLCGAYAPDIDPRGPASARRAARLRSTVPPAADASDDLLATAGYAARLGLIDEQGTTDGRGTTDGQATTDGQEDGPTGEDAEDSGQIAADSLGAEPVETAVDAERADGRADGPGAADDELAGGSAGRRGAVDDKRAVGPAGRLDAPDAERAGGREDRRGAAGDVHAGGSAERPVPGEGPAAAVGAGAADGTRAATGSSQEDGRDGDSARRTEESAAADGAPGGLLADPAHPEDAAVNGPGSDPDMPSAQAPAAVTRKAVATDTDADGLEAAAVAVAAEDGIPDLHHGRAGRRLQIARWTKNRRRAVAGAALALLGGGITVGAVSGGSAKAPRTASVPDPTTPAHSPSATAAAHTPPGHERPGTPHTAGALSPSAGTDAGHGPTRTLPRSPDATWRTASGTITDPTRPPTHPSAPATSPSSPTAPSTPHHLCVLSICLP